METVKAAQNAIKKARTTAEIEPLLHDYFQHANPTLPRGAVPLFYEYEFDSVEEFDTWIDTKFTLSLPFCVVSPYE